MSCDILKADVLALAPQLSTLPDGAWAMILRFLNTMEGPQCDPQLRKLALCLLGAHIGTISGTTGATGATGPVIAETAGGLKVTYAEAVTTANSSDYGLTVYGQQFLAIMKMSSTTRGPILV